MTKKTLFAAASVAAIIAGGAQAGEITGSVGSIAFGEGDAYTLASELANDTDLSGSLDLSYDVTDADISIDGGSPDVVYRVVIGLSGGTFDSPTDIDLSANTEGDAVVTFQPAARTATSLTYIATVEGGTGGGVVTGFSFDDAAISTTGAGGLRSTATLEIIAGGLATNVDTTSATITDTAAYITGNASWGEGPYTLTALLPDFTELSGNTLANDLGISTSTGSIYTDLTGTAASLEAILDTVTVTVSGRQFEDVQILLGEQGPDTATLTNSSASFEITASELDSGTLDLTIGQFAEGDVAFQAGAFTTTVTYEVNEGFEAQSADGPIASGAIVLDGVNFVAPWVSGTGASTSVIRVGNNDDDVSGDVTVRLLNAVSVVSGVAVPFEYDGEPLNLGAIPAGGDLQITSADLVAHFGAFTRGDFQITVQSDSDNLSAKMRNTRNGQSFEQSLGASSFGVIDDAD